MANIGSKKQRRAIEIMAILCTVFGTLAVNTLLLIYSGGKNFFGHELLITELAFFGCWYVVAALLLVLAHPDPGKLLMLFVSILIAFPLLLTSDVWIDPDIGWLSWFATWLEVFAHYLMVIPIFVFIGHLAEVSKRAKDRTA